MGPNQTAPIGAVCSGSTLFASILNSSVMSGNYLQQTTSANDIFRCIFSWHFTLRANYPTNKHPSLVHYEYKASQSTRLGFIGTYCKVSINRQHKSNYPTNKHSSLAH